MAKKKTDSVKPSVKRLDKEILALINRRAQAWLDANPLQQETAAQASLVDEQSGIREILQANPGPLSEQVVQAIFQNLQSGSKALSRKWRVAFLGPEQSYSYLAAMQQFGTAHELIPVSSIQAVFEEVDRHAAEFGVVPLENSTDGRIADTLTMFVKLPVKICGEIRFAVEHCLLGTGQRNDIQKICSKPQALSQCRDWLSKHFPSAQVVPMASTAAAAQLAAADKTVAAIASEQAGNLYGLKMLARNVEDNPNNMTRFAVISQQPCKRTGRDKTAIMFEILHQPGSLADVLNVFKRGKLNMTWIESFPMPNLPNEYLFFVEVEGHQVDARVRKAIASLENKTARLVVLGSFPAGL
jgi:chorismate mutase/prephenate dehydratase